MDYQYIINSENRIYVNGELILTNQQMLSINRPKNLTLISLRQWECEILAVS